MENIVKMGKTMHTVYVGLFVLMGVVVVGAFAFCISVSHDASLREAEAKKAVYVLDQGRSLVALQSEGAATRELEAMDHVRQFHQYFFSFAPNAETIKQNMEMAYLLADESAHETYSQFVEVNYYNRLISGNVSQQIQITSIDVDTSSYPYQVSLKGFVYQTRSSAMSRYILETTCRVRVTERSFSNPHGMMIEQFTVKHFELEQTIDR